MTGRINQLMQQAAEEIGAESFCSLILRHPGGLTHVVGDHPQPAERAQVAVRAEQGPCVDAMDQLSGVLIPDVVAEERWPQWRTEVLDAGFRSAAALPAYVGSGAVVALNLYSEQLDPWDADILVRADSWIHEIAAILAEQLR